MFKQLLLTALVIFIVVIVTGFVRRGGSARPAEPAQPVGRSGFAMAGYALVAVLIIVGGVVFYQQWQASNRIVTVRVTSSSGETTTYQVRREDIRGRDFRTVGGRRVSLGQGDRMELIVQD